MFSKAIYASIFVSTLVLQGHAHAGVTPALGVSGTFARSDVQRPSTATPCGTTPLTDIDTSTAAPVNPDGSVDLTATNFNAGADGSRSFTATISADGTTKNMVAAQVTTNGDAAPTNVGSQPLVVQIPPGTTCTGGKDKKRCIVSLQSTSGFGNCVAIIQSGAGGAAGNSTAAAAGNSTAAAATGNNTAAGVDNVSPSRMRPH
ncbi:hypothetical protein K439DRAFT_1325093 [Ramaria rubella]|nr:hypothetical protein K439DRAFT_1325093 [Ramaria rubella]